MGKSLILQNGLQNIDGSFHAALIIRKRQTYKCNISWEDGTKDGKGEGNIVRKADGTKDIFVTIKLWTHGTDDNFLNVDGTKDGKVERNIVGNNSDHGFRDANFVIQKTCVNIFVTMSFMSMSLS